MYVHSCPKRVQIEFNSASYLNIFPVSSTVDWIVELPIGGVLDE
jgi:hypothetical protein